ncbi:hypothetical protein CQ054_22110 [Ochrobactrum sp. MYb29]|nr:hypothetical protein CQ054_22110 [Ochrobactrum sp. MYb29]
MEYCVRIFLISIESSLNSSETMEHAIVDDLNCALFAALSADLVEADAANKTKPPPMIAARPAINV